MSGFIITPTTSATTVEFEITSYEKGATFQLDGVPASGEEITLEQPDGASWTAVNLDDSAHVLRAGHNNLTFYGTGLYRLNKPDTGAVDVGVRVTYHG